MVLFFQVSLSIPAHTPQQITWQAQVQVTWQTQVKVAREVREVLMGRCERNVTRTRDFELNYMYPIQIIKDRFKWIFNKTFCIENVKCNQLSMS